MHGMWDEGRCWGHNPAEVAGTLLDRKADAAAVAAAAAEMDVDELHEEQQPSMETPTTMTAEPSKDPWHWP